MQPTHLDLFSGIGGFALAARWTGFKTICFCETELYCQRVLRKNFGAVRLVPDIRQLDGRDFYGVDLCTGGFPCQPFSVAGLRRGTADDRSLWPEMFRVVKEARPKFVLGENVTGIITMELDNAISDLESIGYSVAPPLVIGAVAVGAKHRRQRVFIVGRNVSDPERNGRSGCAERGSNAAPADQQPSGTQDPLHAAGAGSLSAAGRNVPHSESLGREEQRQSVPHDEGWELGWMRTEHCYRWSVEPRICRVANGIPYRVDRLRGLGNAICPQVAAAIMAEIFHELRPMHRSGNGTSDPLPEGRGGTATMATAEME